jgi:hypothetical protein
MLGDCFYDYLAETEIREYRNSILGEVEVIQFLKQVSKGDSLICLKSISEIVLWTVLASEMRPIMV